MKWMQQVGKLHTKTCGSQGTDYSFVLDTGKSSDPGPTFIPTSVPFLSQACWPCVKETRSRHRHYFPDSRFSYCSSIDITMLLIITQNRGPTRWLSGQRHYLPNQTTWVWIPTIHIVGEENWLLKFVYTQIMAWIAPPYTQLIIQKYQIS